MKIYKSSYSNDELYLILQFYEDMKIDFTLETDPDSNNNQEVKKSLSNNLKMNQAQQKEVNQDKLQALEIFPQQAAFTEISEIEKIMPMPSTIEIEAANLQELKNIVNNFSGCALRINANNTVFSDGNPESRIMLIGEAPGEQEDLKGIPFCGRSGQLLDKMLAAIDLNREKVYITNTVFWRPPGNRKPSLEEIESCKPILEQHIKLINPKLIVLVGGVAASVLLETNIGISQLRGKFYHYKNPYLEAAIPTTVIFHPAYLLRQPMQKTLAWQDLKEIKKFLDKEKI